MNANILWILQEKEQKLFTIQQKNKNQAIIKELLFLKGEIESSQSEIKKKNDRYKEIKKEFSKQEKELSILTEQTKEVEDKLYEDNSLNFHDLEEFQQQVLQYKGQQKNLEDKLIGDMELIENKGQELAHEKEILKNMFNNYQEKLNEYKEFIKDLEAIEKKLQVEIKSMRSKIDEDILKQYNQLQKRFNYTGVAKIKNGCCFRCGVALSILQLNSLKTSNKFHFCEHCNRLLVL